MLGYALWPNDYGNRFWARGHHDIMKATLAPSEAFAVSQPDRRSSQANVTPSANDTTTAGAACVERARANAMIPIDRISTTIRLTEPQRQSLDELRAAVTAGIERESDACRNEAPDSPPLRLEATVRGLWAMRYAEFRIRTALREFSESLTDSQRAQLSERQERGATATPTSPATICAAQATSETDWLGDFERKLTLTDEQHEGFKVLVEASMQMIQYLSNTCPAKTPETPMARFDAAGDRIVALLHAAMGIKPLLDAFYAKLGNEQRAQVD
jgi:hypothetical protein